MKRFNIGKHKDDDCFTALVPFKRFGIDSLFGDFFSDAFSGFGFLKAFRSPSIDVYEENDKFIVKAELPGIDKKEIKLNIDKDLLTISGDTKIEKEEKKKGYYYAERSFGRIQRSIRLPEGVKQDEIKASYKDGVLTIEAPLEKTIEHKGKDIEIE